jgi:hypothetical protein
MVGGCVGRRLKEMLESELGLWWKEGSGEKISSHVVAGGSRSGNSLEITATRSNDLNLNHASSDLSPLKKGLLTLLRVDICFVILLKSQG